MDFGKLFPRLHIIKLLPRRTVTDKPKPTHARTVAAYLSLLIPAPEKVVALLALPSGESKIFECLDRIELVRMELCSLPKLHLDLFIIHKSNAINRIYNIFYRLYSIAGTIHYWKVNSERILSIQSGRLYASFLITK